MLQIKLGEVTLIVLIRMAGLVNYYIIIVYVNCYAHRESIRSNAQIYSVEIVTYSNLVQNPANS